VFLEAMAFGLPIICYDRGGQTDFLKSGETGLVVRLNDEDAFTQAIVDLHVDMQRRHRFGEYNRSLVESYFIDTCAQRYEEVFEEVIAMRPTRGERSDVAPPHPAMSRTKASAGETSAEQQLKCRGGMDAL
jgi:hypothetical protein